MDILLSYMPLGAEAGTISIDDASTFLLTFTIECSIWNSKVTVDYCHQTVREENTVVSFVHE